MRIGVVTSSYPRHPGDPAGSFVAAHVEAMRALGHEVDVVAANGHGGSLFDGAGAPEEMERRGWRAVLDGVMSTTRLTAEVVKRANDWDAVIAHWLPCAVAALPAIRPLYAEDARPLLAIAHGGDIHTLRRLRLLRPTLATLRARGARFAFVSDELRALAGVDETEAIVQPMGVDLAHFAALRRAPTIVPTIAIIARLVPIKGVDIAIEAFGQLKTRARLVIAGDGPEREALEQRARAIIERDPKRGVIEFLGTVDAERRDELLRQANVVVVPSRVLANGRSEGMPLVALEALAAGVPVIASATGGLRELRAITHVAPDNARELASAIDRVLAAKPAPDALRASVEALAWDRVALRLLTYCEDGDTRSRRSA